MSATRVMPRGDGPSPDSILASKNPNLEKQDRRRTVLIVDDEYLIADTLADILNDSGEYFAVAVYDGASALQRVRNSGLDVLITDVLMPEMNGIELAKAIKSICPETRIVLLSGQAQTRDLVQQAEREGYRFELWAKPMHPDEILKRLSQKQA
ncbi:MAG TPA: response regulator [Terriglobales bacterium]|jgi:CheY-like chemotaxis protein|nr:response regulator [Terriglobales bacterium]